MYYAWVDKKRSQKGRARAHGEEKVLHPSESAYS